MSDAYEVAEERLASSSTHTSAASSAGSAANSAGAKAHLAFVSGSHSAVGAMATPRASRSSTTGRIPRTSRDAGGTANPTPYAFNVASLRHQMRVNSRAFDVAETDARNPRSLALHTLPISESSHLAATDSTSSPTNPRACSERHAHTPCGMRDGDAQPWRSSHSWWAGFAGAFSGPSINFELADGCSEDARRHSADDKRPGHKFLPCQR